MRVYVRYSIFDMIFELIGLVLGLMLSLIKFVIVPIIRNLFKYIIWQIGRAHV